MKTLDDLVAEGVSGRTVLVRSDLNVPLDGDRITDDGRIRASVPTHRATLLDAGARVVVDRPPGPAEAGRRTTRSTPSPRSPARLGELLGTEVTLADHGDEAQVAAGALADGGVVLLENIRFDPRETSKDDAERRALAAELAALAGPTGRSSPTVRRRAPQAGVGLRRRAAAAGLRRRAGAQPRSRCCAG